MIVTWNNKSSEGSSQGEQFNSAKCIHDMSDEIQWIDGTQVMELDKLADTSLEEINEWKWE